MQTNKHFGECDSYRLCGCAPYVTHAERARFVTLTEGSLANVDPFQTFESPVGWRWMDCGFNRPASQRDDPDYIARSGDVTGDWLYHVAGV